ncbi:hypothetical protein E4T66_11060 [Sinimarinibacterium sp. CAU 1509]|uniref:hypothetical protein n=1 Tax=Sinimarinibacterium sp. CAU 1509 TaxID=2562283 RepID=UPI0010AB68FB|nr:hypothetical protein [Sinimarinibacterium sp. CAU 1509]TJY61155.1 hypothetical protein E4T66_11060 [Sinimarinibacterium sp. CAU 1509]
MTARLALFALALISGWQPAAAQDSATAPGTTIVGEQDTAVGLYLTPWQDETASDVDRPPGLYAPPLAQLDPMEFQRLVDYDDARLAYRRERLQRSR